MIRMVHRDNRSEYSGILEQQFRLRYDVFVQEHSCTAASRRDSVETDEYDNDHAIYMISVDDQETVLGSYRLYPTLLPNMLSEQYAHLIDGAIPSRSDIYELSRFALRTSPWLKPVYRELTASLFEFGLENGLTGAISVIPAWRLPLICAAGYRVRPLGLPNKIGGRSCMAVVLEFDEIGLSRMRKLCAITASVFDHNTLSLQRPLP